MPPRRWYRAYTLNFSGRHRSLMSTKMRSTQASWKSLCSRNETMYCSSAAGSILGPAYVTRRLPISGCAVTGHRLRNKWVWRLSSTISLAAARSRPASTSQSEHSTSSRSIQCPSSTATVESVFSDTSTEPPAHPDRSRTMASRTSAGLRNSVIAKEPRYSFSDFDSIRFAVVAGTRISAVATTGRLPGPSQVSSQAFHMSSPLNGRSSPSPSAARLSLRGTAKRTSGAYVGGYSVSLPSGRFVSVMGHILQQQEQVLLVSCVKYSPFSIPGFPPRQ